MVSFGHPDVLGDVSLCCGIGNVLGLGITAGVLRVSARAFSGIVKDKLDNALTNPLDQNMFQKHQKGIMGY